MEAATSKSSLSMLTKTIHEHIGVPDPSTCCWEIRQTQHKGRGLFATRDIQPNEVIFRDPFLLAGPNTERVCVNCYVDVNVECDICPRGCGLPICVKCQSSERHQHQECQLLNKWKPIDATKVAPHVVKNLTAIRSLFLKDNELELLYSLQANSGPKRVDEISRLAKYFSDFANQDEDQIQRMTVTVAAINTSGYQTMIRCENNEAEVSLKCVYALTALMNHSCAPNTRHAANSELSFVISATKKIPSGEEITSTYSQFLWNTPSRRLHLAMTKQFFCMCPRCSSPTEFDTFLSSFYCTTKTCQGLLVATTPLNLKSPFQCSECQQTVPNQAIGKLQEMLPAVVTSQTKGKSVEEMLAFLNGKLLKLVPAQNQFVMDIKIGLIWKIKCCSETSLELIRLKSEFCDEVLSVLEKLGAGDCILKGLVALEKFCCARLLGSEDKSSLMTSWTILKENVAQPAKLIKAANELHLEN